MNVSISEASVGNNFILRFTLIHLIFLNWDIRKENFSLFILSFNKAFLFEKI